MAGETAADFQLFTETHRAALETSGVPPLYWESLHHKLAHEIFDAGEVFGIMQFENEEGDEDAEEEEITHNPGTPPVYKVIITKEDGLQAADANR
ncbi:tubulin--tyrosine ligase-like protein 12 [Rhincodon typus]|uniref:tubulin--tyrosine ligase-like protein 12 n=1 Tax=Rhincodon typus TaxID=259920 RepID=UPI00202E5DC4|nr:tubulin--tyrosine ligase-like protein 12 [Rhincodon typus]